MDRKGKEIIALEINSFYMLSYGVFTDFMRLEDNRFVMFWWWDQYFPISFHHSNLYIISLDIFLLAHACGVGCLSNRFCGFQDKPALADIMLKFDLSFRSIETFFLKKDQKEQMLTFAMILLLLRI